MAFILNWAQDKAAGLLATGIQASGTLAGNAVGSVGTLIENSGRALGEGVNGSIRGVGSSINSYGNNIIGSMAADGPVNRSSVTQKKSAVTASSASRNATAKSMGKPQVAGTHKPGSMVNKSRSSSSMPGYSLATARSNGNGKTRISPQSRPRSTADKRSLSTLARSNPRVSVPVTANRRKTPAGKTRISPESRPR